jgi:DNA-binding CsgD family transcriptional regulator
VLASFAQKVSPGVQRALKNAEALGLRGDAESALSVLREAAAGLGPNADDDRVAVGELALVISAWSGQVVACQAFLEQLVDTVTSPSARGALFFHRGRASQGSDSLEYLNRALDEFTIAGDVRGRAVTLGQLCWPTENGAGPEYRLRVGREALELAVGLNDPWAIAFCAGRLAGCETYLDHPDALRHWRQAAQVLPSSPDSITAEIASLNQFNWALTALGHGSYELAREVINDGKVLAHGRGWARKFTSLDAMLAWRTGDPAGAISAATAARDGDPDNSTHIGAIVLCACAVEHEGRPAPALIDEAVAGIAFDEQLTWLATAVQAELRALRREPAPLRDLPHVPGRAWRMRIHFGWEDAVLVMARHDVSLARDALSAMTPLWPSYPRGQAIHDFVGGLVAGHHGYAQLRAAAEGFLALPEPVTAGRALHAAARVAPSVSEGNALRLQALELFAAAGADRSAAALLRDRTLHRGGSTVLIPSSQRRITTAGLTSREREVAALAARGYTAAEIASELHITVSTARQHLLKVRSKFGGVPKRRLTMLLAPSSSRPGSG